MSAISVCPATILNVPSNPAKILIAMNISKLILNAVPIEHKNKTQILALYAVRRPNVAASGAHTSEELPMTMRTPALHILMFSLVVLRVSAMLDSAGNRHVELKDVQKVMRDATKRIRLLCQLGR